MNSLTDLREVVDVVIGVDTHVHTHSAAALDTATGGVLGEVTVDATAGGYAELVEFANNHATLRAWAIEGTGSYGAVLSRHLLDSSEIVIELDRSKRAGAATARSRTRSMRSERPVKRWPDLGWERLASGRTPSPVSASGCSPLCDQRIHGGSAAGLQPGDRRTGTYPCPVPGSEARGDA